MVQTNKGPLVSIIIPLESGASPDLLRACLRSLVRQTYRQFEVHMLVPDSCPADLQQVLDQHPNLWLHRASMNRSAARNYLARKSQGEYLLYLETDQELSPRYLEQCIKVVMTSRARAIVAPNAGASHGTFWTACRGLEMELLKEDLSVQQARFVSAEAFRRVGGFDEEFELLDDWALSLKLEEEGVLFGRVGAPILVHEWATLAEMFERGTVRGRCLLKLQKRFPGAPLPSFRTRLLRAYLGKPEVLLRSPLHGAGLLLIKLIDLAGVLRGRYQATRSDQEWGTSPSVERKVISRHEELRPGSNLNRFRFFTELQALDSLLNSTEIAALEIGCGSGRISRHLAQRGVVVVPSDSSSTMLAQFEWIANIYGPVQADGLALPFADKIFPGSFSLRVLGQLPSEEHALVLLEEMARVTLEMVVVDVANARRIDNWLVRLAAGAVGRLSPSQHHSHRSSLLMDIPQFVSKLPSIGLKIRDAVPLDVLSPIWLNLLPAQVAAPLFSVLRRLELTLSHWLPPGRLLVRLEPLHREQ